MTIIDFETSNFIAAPEHGLLTTSVMPVIHLKGGVARGVGSCFAISSDGLCLTAQHVVKEALPEAILSGHTDVERDGWLYALYSSDEKNEDYDDHYLGGLLPVQFVHFNGVLDIAALQLGLPRHAESGELLRMPSQRLGMAPPAVGELCFALGYHTMNWEGTGPDYHVGQRFYASRGIVEELHIPNRDAVMAPFPCFRTSARYDGGMSGGPVIGIDGLVRGVVCSSMSGLADQEGYVSYASLIGPSAMLQVSRLDEQGNARTYFIHDLAERGIVLADYTGVPVERLQSQLAMRIGGYIVNSVIGG